MGASAGALPLVENQAPDIAEDNNQGHEDGPTCETIFTHFGLAHAVKHELEIPGNAGEGREDIIVDEGGAAVEVIFGRAIFNVQENAPDEVRDKATCKDNDKNGIGLP